MQLSEFVVMFNHSQYLQKIHFVWNKSTLLHSIQLGVIVGSQSYHLYNAFFYYY